MYKSFLLLYLMYATYTDNSILHNFIIRTFNCSDFSRLDSYNDGILAIISILIMPMSCFKQHNLPNAYIKVSFFNFRVIILLTQEKKGNRFRLTSENTFIIYFSFSRKHTIIILVITNKNLS